MDVYPWLAAAAAFGVAHFVKGIAGFGSALIAMPVLLSVLPPQEAILVLAAVDLVTGAWLVKDVWRTLRPELVVGLVAGMALGQGIGTGFVDRVRPEILRGLLGAVVLLMGVRYVVQPVRPGRGERVAPTAALVLQGSMVATVGGILAGLIGAGGPPIVLWVRHNFVDAMGRAHLLAVFQAGWLSLALLLLARGTPPATLVPVPLVVLPALLGSRLGARLAPRLDRHRFARFVGLLLTVSGIGLLVRSVGA